MNLLGKILTGVILVMSLIFATVAMMVGATTKNWKAQADSLTQKVQTAQRLNEGLRGDIDELKMRIKVEAVSRAAAIQALNTLNLNLLEEVKSKEALLTAKTIETERALAELATSNARLKEQDARVLDLQSKNETLIADLTNTKKKLAGLIDNNNQIVGNLEIAKERREQLENILALYTRIMAKNGLDADDETKDIPPANLAGKITSADRERVVISMGKDNGIRVGHQLDVLRGDRFIGRITVTEIQEKRATAKIEKSLTQTAIQKDDKVITYYATSAPVPKG